MSALIAQLIRAWGKPNRIPPAMATWDAACPQCKVDARWASTIAQQPGAIARYAVDCPSCGVYTWRASNPTPTRKPCRTCHGEGWVEFETSAGYGYSACPNPACDDGQTTTEGTL